MVACYPIVLRVKEQTYHEATLTSVKAGFYPVWFPDGTKQWKVREIRYEFQPLKDGSKFVVEANLAPPKPSLVAGHFEPVKDRQEVWESERLETLNLSGVRWDALETLAIAQTNGLVSMTDNLFWLQLVSEHQRPVWQVNVYIDVDVGGTMAMSSRMIARIDARTGSVRKEVGRLSSP